MSGLKSRADLLGVPCPQTRRAPFCVEGKMSACCLVCLVCPQDPELGAALLLTATELSTAGVYLKSKIRHTCDDVRSRARPGRAVGNSENMETAAPLPGVCVVTETAAEGFPEAETAHRGSRGVRGTWVLFARRHPAGLQTARSCGRPAGDAEVGGSEPRSSAAITTCGDVASDA